MARILQEKGVRTQMEGEDRAESLPMSKKRKKGDDKKSTSLLLDLIIEILTRLPPKSMSKLICVSKLWFSIIQSKHFTELYLARSSTRARLLIEVLCDGKSFYHSISQEDLFSDHKANTIPLLGPVKEMAAPIRGLICYRNEDNVVICNPSTNQFLTLPQVNRLDTSKKYQCSFFGYDPVDDLYKVLFMTVRYGSPPFNHKPPVVSEEHQVFTLGVQKTWRMIECKHPHRPATQGVCNNGVLYYGAFADSSGEESLLVSFDLSSEEFSVIALPEDVRIDCHYPSGLANYNGKIALVDKPSIGKFEFWVLEDFTNQEWSKFSVSVPSWNDLTANDHCRFWGTISTGELVFSIRHSLRKFFVIFYDPKKDKGRRVEFEKKKR